MKRIVGFTAGLAVGVFVCATLAQKYAPLAAENSAGKSGEECVAPAKGPVSAAAAQTPRQDTAANSVGQVSQIAGVGRPAPDFEAAAFVDGGFKNLKLSDFRGKWVVLCFYPGDFTFV